MRAPDRVTTMDIIFRLIMSEMRSVITLFFILLFVSGCSKEGQKELVVYTSVDQVFSEPILKDFEREMSIKAKAVYDVEATKTQILRDVLSFR